MFNDKIEAKDFPKMPREYQELLIRVLTIQADCEIGGPHLYVRRWLLAAPTAEDQMGVARVAMEEIDHFRKMKNLLKELGVDVSHLLWRPSSEKMVDAFRSSMDDWAEFGIFGLLIDRVGLYQLEEFIGTSYAPLERVLPQIISEEKGHIRFGIMKLKELIEKGPEGRELAQKALNKWYPLGLDMFGMTGSQRNERYRYWGLKRRRNEEAREEYMKEVNPIIGELGLEVPDPLKGRKFL